MKFKNYFDKTIQFLNPRVPVGGLEISDGFLRFASLGPVRKFAYARLSPGVLKDGWIEDEKSFLESLKKLREEIGDARSLPSVVVSLRSPAIYSEQFSLPVLPKEKIQSAIELNLASVSPLDGSKSYSDAEAIGRGPSGEEDYLGAFVPRELIDALLKNLKETGFVVVAVEFSGLSLVRSLRTLGGYDSSRGALVIRMGTSGLDFQIIKNNNLYFEYLSSWADLLENDRQINLDKFLDFLRRETSRILNFYSGKWGGSISEVLIASVGFPEEGRSALEGLGLKAKEAALLEYRDVGSDWFVALGAAKRGEAPRSADKFISLAPVGTEEEYRRNRTIHFVGFWRTAIAAVFISIFGLFLIADSFLARSESSLDRDLRVGVPPELLREVESLQNEAKEFNRIAGLALSAKSKSLPKSQIFVELKKIAGSKIIIRRIYSDEAGNIFITGRAPSELAAITFKNSLSQSLLFGSVNLPLANIASESDGGVGFQLTLTIK